MRKCFASILLLVTSASLALSVQQPATWITYTSPEGRYNVSLPAQPTVKTQESTTADGVKFPQYLATVVEDDGAVLMIGYFDVLPGTSFSAAAARDAMVKSVNGTLNSETAISLGGYSGREIEIFLKLQAPEGAKPFEPVEYIDRARIYEADKRVYILQMIFPKALEKDAAAAKVTKYFDSFQVVTR